MQKFQQELKIDQQARTLCKPYGCRVMKCLSQLGVADCQQYLRELNQCIEKKKQQIREGKPSKIDISGCQL